MTWGRGAQVAAFIWLAAMTGCVHEDRIEGSGQREGSFESVQMVDTAQVAHFTLDAAPEVVFKSDSEVNLFRVTGVVRLSPNSLAIVNGGEHELLIYNELTGTVAHLGRAGEGPGEFRAMSPPIRLPNGGLAVFDSRLHRLTRITDGKVSSSVNLEVSQWAPQPAVVGVLPGGAIIVTSYASPLHARGVPRLERDTMPLVRYSANGQQGRLLRTYLGAEFVVKAPPGRSDGPLDRAPREFGISSDIATSGDRIIIADNEHFVIAVYDDMGVLLRRFQLPVTGRPVSDSALKALRTQRVAYVTSASERKRKLSRITTGARPRDTMPLFEPRVVTDAMGRLWLGSYILPADTLQHWWCITVDGELVADVDVNAAFRPTDVVGDAMLGVWTADNGEETVRQYHLRHYLTGAGG